MAAEVRIPKLGVAMTQGSVIEWLVEDGAHVDSGELLYILATDKTETEVAAPATGKLAIMCDLDVEYDVGTLIAQIG